MIEGASNRVPAAPHWDIFRQAELQQPELIASLSEEIQRYVAPLTEVNSTTAGHAILPNWPGRNEWNRHYAANSSQLFGMVVWVTLFDCPENWRTTSEPVGDRQVRIYRRA
jgi:hypothetical protein